MQPTMARAPLLAAAVLAIALTPVTPSRVAAEIFSWTDADGHVHYTQDLQGVPPEHRGEAREKASEEPAPSRVQTFSNEPASAAPPARQRPAYSAARSGGARRVHHIPVQRAGNGMIVPVRLNDSVVAPFLIDTGASYVLVPKAVADEAGIQVGPDARKLQFSTANGVVEHAVVTLDSVELGTARVEDVPASISPNMEIGLLGLSFFNRFTYQIDAANGVLTLIENDLAENGDLRGGRSESQWRSEFGALRQRMEWIEAQRSSAPSTHGRLVEALEEQHASLEHELERLESEANDAHVPDAWRE